MELKYPFNLGLMGKFSLHICVFSFRFVFHGDSKPNTMKLNELINYHRSVTIAQWENE